MGGVGKTNKATTITTSNGDYDITPMGSGFTVEIGGDERYYDNYDDAISAIWADAYWVNAPLKDKNGLYNANDLQTMLDFIRGNNYARQEFISALPNTLDGIAIRDVISDGSVEQFDKYDSAVIEQFIDLYNSFK